MGSVPHRLQAINNMADNRGNEFLNVLLGEQLSSVIFVMDYLQLDFDGNRFTLNVWPQMTIGDSTYRFGETSYRDHLCSLIAQIVKQATGEDKQHLAIIFESGDKIMVPLNESNPALNTSEIAVFTDVNGHWYLLK